MLSHYKNKCKEQLATKICLLADFKIREGSGGSKKGIIGVMVSIKYQQQHTVASVVCVT